ncbi:MAG: lysophospholipid acyltransferase family protein [Candidatus Gastranaerophilales bacterium]|nr:lysophospholipid acyltransferase family protein [Candidatus Gastranaerophilales bacterium]
MESLSTYFRRFRKKYGFEIISAVVTALFKLEKIFYVCKCINYPKEQCLFALWHAHQCGVFSCNMHKKTCIMVSNSQDGEIVSRAANAVGVETVRGSHQKGGTKASLELIKKIKEEGLNGALTIDGPRGPNRVVKKGIIEIAKMTGVPIVPAVYWSPEKRFLQFNSWDKFRFPLFGTKLVMVFGDPIPVGENPTPEEIESIRKQIEDKMHKLYKDLKENYHKYQNQK